MVTQFASRHARRLRAACLLAAGSLLCGLAVAPPALAAPAARAAGTAPAKPATTGGQSSYQTELQAVARARQTGRSVPVVAATTPTSTTSANPDGTLTVTESASPVRTWAHGAWQTLNASLARNPDGTWSPAVSDYPLALSGGGTGPLATMTYGSYSLALTAPMRLPAPTISGATATYDAILPDVDLIVTAQASGGYSEALRIGSRAAAASAALASLTFTTRARGLSVSTAGNGTIAARNSRGQVIFAAPSPRMWDSAVPARAQRALASAGITRASAARLLASTPTTPGLGAHAARLGVTASGSRLSLVPDRSLLTGAGTVYPVYIDPDWDAAAKPASNWTYISEDYPTAGNYDAIADGTNFLQVGEMPTCDSSGNCNADSGYKSYSFWQMPVPSQIEGTRIYSATAYFPEVWADSCTQSPVDLWTTTTAISGSTTWDNPPTWGAKIGLGDNTAYGWNSADVIGGPSGCATTADQVHYDISSLIDPDASKTGTLPALNLGLQAESGAVAGWKLFATPDTTISGNLTITIQYAYTPGTPSLSTSVTGTSCNGTKDAGDGNVTLQATTTDKDNISPEIQYTAYAAGNTSDTFAANLASPGLPPAATAPTPTRPSCARPT